MNKCVVVTTDSEYLPYFNVFYKSFFKHVNGIELFVLAINIEDKNEFSKLYDKAKIFYVDRELDDSLNLDETTKIGGKKVSDKVTFCSKVMFLMFDKFFDMGYDVLYLDVDAIINRDISFIFDFFNDHDLILIPTGNHWSGGFLGFKNSDISKKILALIKIQLLALQRLWQWKSQPIVKYCVTQFIDQVKIKELDSALYFDWRQYTDDCYIWCGKGARKGYAQYKMWKTEEEIEKAIGYTKSDIYINRMVEYGYDKKHSEL